MKSEPVHIVYLLWKDDGNVCCGGKELVAVYGNQQVAEMARDKANTPKDPTRWWDVPDQHWVDTKSVIFGLPSGG